ncbi:hypothetical protein NE237_029849 [Protea cynaroides]|uniref:Ubiquitin carboxyl-terminal hydrolase n=1 Tax=Protea cynaroides TaxID=273540 RepID=A0A9Q0GRY7_9MAGN|nr:hypothetical protein NE237_029849 [Protea cynaroides]
MTQNPSSTWKPHRSSYLPLMASSDIPTSLHVSSPSAVLDSFEGEASSQPSTPNSEILDDDPSASAPLPPPPSETLESVLPFSSSPLRVETLDTASASSVRVLGDRSISAASSPSKPAVVDSSDDQSIDASSSYWLSLAESKTFYSSPNNSFLWRSSEFRPFFSPTSFGDVKPTMMGAGLENLGNTCFLNAILQCFTHTVPLIEGLRSWNHAAPCARGAEGFCVLCTLRDHIELSLAYSGGVISPLKLVENLSNLSSSFARFQQEDAHEFLQCLLDRLDTCSLDHNSQNQNLSPQEDGIVKQIFGGRFRSQLRCCNCGHCSNTFESLIDLSLEIEDVDSLPSALQSFTKVEKIDPEARFTCENCKQKVSVEKQLMLDQAPSVAAFHLKRFKSDGSNVEKIDNYVAYPLELDLSSYTSSNHSNNVDLKYELYAVVVHVGFSPWSGHYFCFIRSSPHTWHRLDDSEVIRVEEEGVLSQEAYILFYARQSLPWFSTLMETQKNICIGASSRPWFSTLMETQKNICFGASSGTTSPESAVDEVEGIYIFNVEDEARSNAERSDSSCTMEIDESRHDVQTGEARIDEATINDQILSTVSSTEASNCNDKVDGPSYDDQRVGSTSPMEANNCSHEVHEIINNVSVPQTLPRSPSPDIYSEEPSELVYSIPRDHLRIKDVVKKASGNKNLEDWKKKEACRLTRNMHSSRGSQLMNAMSGSHSDGSLNRKKRHRMSDLSDEGQYESPRSLMCAVTSADLR